jgi:hypothetical protein
MKVKINFYTNLGFGSFTATVSKKALKLTEFERKLLIKKLIIDQAAIEDKKLTKLELLTGKIIH